MPMPDRRTFEVPRQKGGIHFYQAVHPATVTRFGGDAMCVLLPAILLAGNQTPAKTISISLSKCLPALSPISPVCLGPYGANYPIDGPYMHAAIIHDWLYWDQQRPREEADNILWVDMTDLKVGYLSARADLSGRPVAR